VSIPIIRLTTPEITMKTQLRALTFTVGLLCAATGFAQTAAPVAKASASVTTPAAPAAKAPAAPMAPLTPLAKPGAAPAASAAASAAAPAKSAVAGGGAGKVWVNPSSKTYHCEGTQHYGKTKAGEYMTEADAKTKGNHAAQGKACTK
jgi:hypothetical protein